MTEDRLSKIEELAWKDYEVSSGTVKELLREILRLRSIVERLGDPEHCPDRSECCAHGRYGPLAD